MKLSRRRIAGVVSVLVVVGAIALAQFGGSVSDSTGGSTQDRSSSEPIDFDKDLKLAGEGDFYVQGGRFSIAAGIQPVPGANAGTGQWVAQESAGGQSFYFANANGDIASKRAFPALPRGRKWVATAGGFGVVDRLSGCGPDASAGSGICVGRAGTSSAVFIDTEKTPGLSGCLIRQGAIEPPFLQSPSRLLIRLQCGSTQRLLAVRTSTLTIETAYGTGGVVSLPALSGGGSIGAFGTDSSVASNETWVAHVQSTPTSWTISLSAYGYQGQRSDIVDSTPSKLAAPAGYQITRVDVTSITPHRGLLYVLADESVKNAAGAGFKRTVWLRLNQYGELDSSWGTAGRVVVTDLTTKRTVGCHRVSDDLLHAIEFPAGEAEASLVVRSLASGTLISRRPFMMLGDDAVTACDISADGKHAWLSAKFPLRYTLPSFKDSGALPKDPQFTPVVPSPPVQEFLLGYAGGLMARAYSPTAGDALQRRNANTGAIDATFGTGGKIGGKTLAVISNSSATYLTSNCTSSTAVVCVRKLVAGKIDTTWGSSGTLPVNPATFGSGCSVYWSDSGFKALGANSVIANVACPNYIRKVVKYTGGKLDTAFGSKGVYTFSGASSSTAGGPIEVYPQGSGEIMFVRPIVDRLKPGAYKIQLYRLTAKGVLDSAFGFGGGTERNTGAIAASKDHSVTPLSVTRDSQGRYRLIYKEVSVPTAGGDRIWRTVLLRFTGAGAVDKTLNNTGAAQLGEVNEANLVSSIPNHVGCMGIVGDEIRLGEIGRWGYRLSRYSVSTGAKLKRSNIPVGWGRGCAFSSGGSRFYVDLGTTVNSYTL